MNVMFRPYCRTDYPACLDLFDSNCPEFFAPDERQDYQCFLEGSPEGYEICEVDGWVLGVFGLSGDSSNEQRLNWLMVDAKAQGKGLGAMIMERAIRLGRRSESKTLGIATSQKVAPFYQKYGAQTISVTKDGYGPGIDRVDMVLPL